MHTLEMARRHPGNMHVYYDNGTLFYLDPEYRQQVADILEAQIDRCSDDHEYFQRLAQVYAHNAVRREFDHPADRERWLRYFGLPLDFELPLDTDEERADKAVSYFRQAIAVADGEEFYPAFYTQQLAKLLMELERYDEALLACETVLSDVDETSGAGFYLSYAHCLWHTDRIDEARAAAGEVLTSDGDGFSGGPGCRAARAHLLLGRMALGHDANIEAAKKHLLDAAAVQNCCHNMTQGLPLTLARDLLEHGESAAVANFCETVLANFNPSHKPAQELLIETTPQHHPAHQPQHRTSRPATRLSPTHPAHPVPPCRPPPRRSLSTPTRIHATSFAQPVLPQSRHDQWPSP